MSEQRGEHDEAAASRGPGFGKKGDALARKGQYAKAIEVYRDGVDLLPRPKAHWEAATWLLAAIADAQFLAGEFAAAVDTLEDAKFCPGAIGNPFVHLRLGQCLLETGQRDRALDELARAYHTWAPGERSSGTRTRSTSPTWLR